MAKTLEQRIAQLEKLITDFFTGGSSKTKSRRITAPRKAKKRKTAKKTSGRQSSRKSSRR